MEPVIGETSDPNVHGVLGISHSTASAVSGVNDFAPGPGLGGNAAAFESLEGEGIRGTAKNPSHAGVFGRNTAGGIGVFGESSQAAGISVFGQSDEGIGVFGVTHGQFRNAVVGINDFSGAGPGNGGNGGAFESSEGEGVRGTCKNAIHAGVVGKNSAGGIAIFGESLLAGGVGIHAKGARLAGFFDGDVQVAHNLRVDGDVRITHNIVVDGDVQFTGADLAEEFGVVGRLPDPGSVVVLAGDDRVRVSDEPYDHRVAGIVSGAGAYRPGIILDRQPGADRCALALSGKVWCKVDADCAPVDVGDMLTTSPTPGHAMRATDPTRAFGAVVGKALGSLRSGRGLVPVLVTLQ
jgi:hypothetical protein